MSHELLESRADELLRQLGIRESQARVLILRYRRGWRIIVTRLRDGVTIRISVSGH